MPDRLRSIALLPETYALLLAGWYALLLTLGIPSLPPAGHVAGALAFIAILGGAAVTASRLDRSGLRRTAGRLALGFVAGALAVSLVTAGTGHSVKSFMRSMLLGRVLIGVVGACLFVGVVVGVATLLRSLVRTAPSRS